MKKKNKYKDGKRGKKNTPAYNRYEDTHDGDTEPVGGDGGAGNVGASVFQAAKNVGAAARYTKPTTPTDKGNEAPDVASALKYTSIANNYLKGNEKVDKPTERYLKSEEY